MEAVLFLGRWRVHRGRLGQAARPLHLGEEHRQPCQDPARHARRAAAGCGGELILMNPSQVSRTSNSF